MIFTGLLAFTAALPIKNIGTFSKEITTAIPLSRSGPFEEAFPLIPSQNLQSNLKKLNSAVKADPNSDLSPWLTSKLMAEPFKTKELPVLGPSPFKALQGLGAPRYFARRAKSFDSLPTQDSKNHGKKTKPFQTGEGSISLKTIQESLPLENSGVRDDASTGAVTLSHPVKTTGITAVEPEQDIFEKSGFPAVTATKQSPMNGVLIVEGNPINYQRALTPAQEEFLNMKESLGLTKKTRFRSASA
jgi:hypothetical protein